jgi:Flp pilus assembly pilin Flp
MVAKNRERGQGLTEYAFLITFVALVVLIVLVLLGGGVEGLYENTILPIVDALT